MKEEKSNCTNEKFIIENNIYVVGFADEMLGVDCTPDVERKIYQDYLRNQNTEQKSFKDIDYKNLENVFTKRADYWAMKKLTLMEKFTIYIYTFYPQYVEKLCKDTNVPLEYFRKTMKNGVRRFLKYQKLYLKKSGNYNYKKKGKNKKKYHKKGGV